MKKFSKIQFILLNIIVLIVMIVSGAFLIKIIQLFLTNLFFLFSSLYLFNKSPFSKRTTLLIIFVPILLLYGGGYIYDLIYDEGFTGEPFFWGYLLIAILIYLISINRISKKNAIYFFIPFCFVLTAYVWYNSVENEKEKIELTQMVNTKLIDKAGNEYFLNSFKGKLTLFEFWTTSCAQCPESIANFQNLANQYESNKNIDFRVVNINLGKRHNENIFKQIESEIKLEKLYANEDIFKQLNFNAAPSVLILDVQGGIVYFGYPNFYKLTKNNLKDIIENELTKM